MLRFIGPAEAVKARQAIRAKNATAALAAMAAVVISSLDRKPAVSRLFEMLQCRATGGRDAAAIGHQAVSDALAVRNELPANGLRIHHTGVLILLRIGRRRDRREREEKQSKH
jgi:hypothetical protein